MNLEPNIYCYGHPRSWDDPHQVKLHISKTALNKLSLIPRGEEHQLKGIIAYDQISRCWFAIRHHPCFPDSWDCCCAAQAVQIRGPVKYKWEPVIITSPYDPDDED